MNGKGSYDFTGLSHSPLALSSRGYFICDDKDFENQKRAERLDVFSMDGKSSLDEAVRTKHTQLLVKD